MTSAANVFCFFVFLINFLFTFSVVISSKATPSISTSECLKALAPEWSPYFVFVVVLFCFVSFFSFILFYYLYIRVDFTQGACTESLDSQVQGATTHSPHPWSHGLTGRGSRGAAAQLGNLEFLGSKRKFGQSHFLKTFSWLLYYYFEEISIFY